MQVVLTYNPDPLRVGTTVTLEVGEAKALIREGRARRADDVRPEGHNPESVRPEPAAKANATAPAPMVGNVDLPAVPATEPATEPSPEPTPEPADVDATPGERRRRKPTANDLT